ncbi:cytoplasmic protein [Glaciecola punicea]|nr:cytoplasmic protein [Glaciecola punicea]
MLATCEHNYSCMLKLLPDCDTRDLHYEFEVGRDTKYRIQIVDSSRYTSTLKMAQLSNSTPAFLQPKMVVRLYHDAKVAEVLEAQRTSRLKPVYEYPNLNMHQRNEKHMVNVFLAEWLHFCLSQRLASTAN